MQKEILINFFFFTENFKMDGFKIKIEPDEVVEGEMHESFRCETPFEIIPYDPPPNIPDELFQVKQEMEIIQQPQVPMTAASQNRRENVDPWALPKQTEIPWLVPAKFIEQKMKKEVPTSKPPLAAAKVNPRDPRLNKFLAVPPPAHAFEVITRVSQQSIPNVAPLAAVKVHKTTKDAETQTTKNTGTLVLELSDSKLRKLTKSQKDILSQFKEVSF